MTSYRLRRVLTRLVLLAVVAPATTATTAAAAPPAGRVAIAWHVTIRPSWLDPSTAPSQLTIERQMSEPVMDLRVPNGVGPLIAKHTIDDVRMSPFAPGDDPEIER